MAHLETLTTLDTSSEKLLRLRALTLGREATLSLEPIRQGLETGRLHGVRVVDGGGTARGLAVWHWQDTARSYAQVVLIYVQPDAPDDVSTVLVLGLCEQLMAVASLVVIEARLRHTVPAVRAAWLDCDFALFERCRVTRSLGRVPLPVVPVPRGYRIRPWDVEYDAAAAALAVRVQAHSIDSAALPAIQPEHMPGLLHAMRAGTYRDGHTWNTHASRIMERAGTVVGYIAALDHDAIVHLAHLGVDPDHRRQGLARALLIYSLMGAQGQPLAQAEMALTTRSPARALVDQLGFQAVDCGEVAIWWRDGRQRPWRR